MRVLNHLNVVFPVPNFSRSCKSQPQRSLLQHLTHLAFIKHCDVEAIHIHKLVIRQDGQVGHRASVQCLDLGVLASIVQQLESEMFCGVANENVLMQWRACVSERIFSVHQTCTWWTNRAF